MNEQESEIVGDFTRIKGALSDWGSRVDHLLSELLVPLTNFVKIWPKHRIKGNKSYLNKVLYRSYSYSTPISEIDDKVATRIVVLKSADIYDVIKLISQADCWSTKITKTMVGPIEDQPTVFDYQSFHLVVYPSGDGTNMDIDSRDLGCEIQIRTLLQHAFAEVSHDSTYKGIYRNDKGIIRHLAKSMALMEATDDYLCSVFTLMGDQQRKYSLYLKELITLYQQFNGAFVREDLNIDLNDRLLELLTYHEVEIADLEAFVQKKRRNYTSAIKPKNGILFEQPISILLGYYLYEHQSVLKEHWPLNIGALQKVYAAFGFSTGPY